ncbi:MAG: hypothetical protein LBD21_09485 [Tannerellaceae bacterium]|jgi:hypothetical protein|nr:hypothetical protein [Tannerellaceae bacterium]
MKDKILSNLPNEKHTLLEISYPEIHIVDRKNSDKTKGIVIYDQKQEDIKSVCLFNNTELEILVDAFGENALPIKKGKHASQCECVVFPSNYDEKSWTLVIETKYAADEEAAFKIRENEVNYPKKMVSQIISTVEYFREKNIIDKSRVVHAIISFPNLIADFNSQLFSFVEKEEWSAEYLLLYKKIRIKGCNAANIISNKRLRFVTD